MDIARGSIIQLQSDGLKSMRREILYFSMETRATGSWQTDIRTHTCAHAPCLAGKTEKSTDIFGSRKTVTFEQYRGSHERFISRFLKRNSNTNIKYKVNNHNPNQTTQQQQQHDCFTALIVRLLCVVYFLVVVVVVVAFAACYFHSVCSNAVCRLVIIITQ